MPDVGTPRQITIAFPEADLDRLQAKLDDARLPSKPIVEGLNDPWVLGTELDTLRSFLDSWKAGNPRDCHQKPVGKPNQGVKAWWQSVEQTLNKYPHYQVEIEGITVHYQHFKPSTTSAMPPIPLIFSHGWPGSFVEAYPFASRLVENKAPPFESYMAQGGDWGSMVTWGLATYPACQIYHTNFMPPQPPMWSYPALALEKFGYKRGMHRLLGLVGYSKNEMMRLQRSLEYLSSGNGYVSIQSTKPATLGYALYDDPVGILSWLLEKFREWSDPRCPAFAEQGTAYDRSHLTEENILTGVMIYHLTRSTHTSFLPYNTSTKYFQQGESILKPVKAKPFGHAAFPYELLGGPRSWIPRSFNLVHYREHEYGGHFAALDNPEALMDDVVEFANKHWPRP